ncbi:MAG TPA: phosphatase PAP2 family protein [Terracidiphilus sp.]|nr:phosphatase PAP2 family protein [Terracidiphilus sp.]
MFDFVRSYLDELLTGLFLLLVAALTVAYPPHFATHGGLLLARVVLWSAAILVCVLLAASRFSSHAGTALRFVFEFGPIVVAVVGYVSLRLLDASAITARLGIPSFDHEMMAADVAIFGKTPYLWFMRWGLDSGLFARVMSGFYALYPFTPLLAVGWFLWQGDRKQFRLMRRALIISLYSGYVCYLLIPVSGPLTLAGTTSNFLESTRVYSFLESNFRYLYDCFPSLHTANPWLIVWLSRGKVPGWLMASAVSAGCGITLSTIALQVHYGIDDLAGLAWVFLVASVAKATLPNEGLA